MTAAMMVSVVRTDEGGLYKEKKVTLIDPPNRIPTDEMNMHSF